MENYNNPLILKQACRILREGGLVAMPTETVYGLAADAKNLVAIQKVFRAKGRPADHPLIVHIGTLAELVKWAREIPTEAYRLAERFWPGPLTLVLKKQQNVLDAVTGGQDTVAVRMPNHPIALALLQEYGHGLVAPSANQFGRISPTNEAAVLAELGIQIDLILPGGQSKVGIESTILAVNTKPYTILRQGMISIDTLEDFLGEQIKLPDANTTLRAPGLLASHYAPRSPLHLLDFDKLLAKVSKAAADTTLGPLIVLAQSPAPHHLALNIQWWNMPDAPDAYAHLLYARMRAADNEAPALIIVERPPQTQAWAAILDRLQRAKSKAQ